VHITERKVRLAFVAVSIDVPGRNTDLNQYIGVKLKIWGQLLHASLKVSAPLATDVV
jgi:hypothetical protein